MKEKYYLCIDLKTFFASVECVERKLDPYKTNLVVADPTRGNGGICLAITPKMKALGIKNRCRVFEIPSSVKYITATPRMKKYIEYSAKIYEIYLKYIAKEDIHVYSIDECFLDITSYLKLYNLKAKELANKIIEDIFSTTGITATAGIGTNLFLCKLALDICAKHSSDNIGFLNEDEFKRSIWHHTPITDIWNIGNGIAKRLLKYGVYDLYGVAHLDENILYKEFGVNALFLIDHSWGKESCTIKEIHNYKSKSNSISNSQVLFEDYTYDDAFLVLKEMVELNVLELVDKHLVTNNISMFVGYSKDIISPTGGQMKLNEYTNSYKKINEYFIMLFKNKVIPGYMIRRIGISFNNVLDDSYATIDLFTDVEAEEKEKKIQTTIIEIKKKYGKNSILKGMNLQEKATTTKRNKLIGGHNAE